MRERDGGAEDRGGNVVTTSKGSARSKGWKSGEAEC